MATVPSVPATCILLPATSGDNLLQQLSSLLLKATASNNGIPAAIVTNNVTAGQGSQLLQLITSGIPQTASTECNSAKAVVGSSNPASSPVFVSPSLIATATNDTLPNLQIEIINALLRLQGFTASTSSTTTAKRQAATVANTPPDTRSVGTPDLPGTVSTESTRHASPSDVLVSCKLENTDDNGSVKSDMASNYSRNSTREVYGRNSMDDTCQSSLLLHRLLTGEDANRVRSRSELILADSTREESESPIDSIHEPIIKPEEGSTLNEVSPPTCSASPHQEIPLSLPTPVEHAQTPISTTRPVALNTQTISLTIEQLVEVLREYCQTLSGLSNKEMSGRSPPRIALNATLLNQLLPHLVDSGASPQQIGINQQDYTGDTLPGKTSTDLSTVTDSPPPPLSVNQQMSSNNTDCTCETAKPCGLSGSNAHPKLAESVCIRPRCHSDHQPNRRPLLHANYDPSRYHSQQQQQQYTSSSQQRPRSYSKGEWRCYNRSVRSGLCDSRLVATDCDPNHSLIAKLMLTPEENWDATGSSPATPTPLSTTKVAETGLKDVQCSSAASSPSSVSSVATTIGLTLSADDHLDGCHLPPSSTCYTCSSADCKQALGWLYESDEFVSRYCLGIPRGSLMITVHYFGERVSHSSQALPKEIRDILNRIWPQLLLICMVEKRFTFAVNTTKRHRDEHNPIPNYRELIRASSHSDGITSSKQKNATMSSGHRKETPSSTSPLKSLPVVDGIFVDQLRKLLANGACLGLDSEIYHQMRLTVLAQSAYPNRFNRSYVDQSSDLETKLITDQKDTSVSRLVGTLRLLNQLHSIDPVRLLSLFNLTSTAPRDDHPAAVDASRHSREEIQDGLEEEVNQNPSHDPRRPDSTIKQQLVSGNNTSLSLATVLVGASKRKATTVNRRRFGSSAEDFLDKQTVVAPTLEPILRCRANTFAGDNANANANSCCSRKCKTARLS